MFVRVQSACLWGVEALNVDVEIFRGAGLPGVSLVGLARGATRESWVRVRAALGPLGIGASPANLVVNLVPADRPKDASTLELALAVAVAIAAGKVPAAAVEGMRFWGEVGLDGHLVSSPGGLLVADLARRRRDKAVVLPTEQAHQAALLGGLPIFAADHISDVFAHLLGQRPLRAVPTAAESFSGQGDEQAVAPSPQLRAAGSPATGDAAAAAIPCLSHLVGQMQARFALEVAAAGGHHLLLLGPPGSGKTMLARALLGLLPPLAGDALAEVLRIRVAQLGTGTLPSLATLLRLPFRSPHHSTTVAALLGGGAPLQVGELTRAHRGVLFLDEFPEFPRRTLEALREPLEEGVVHLSRHGAAACLPAQVLLVAAANPCPCGYYLPPEAASYSVAAGQLDGATPGPARRSCVCDFAQVTRYRARLSGPLLDRIDLHVRTEPVAFGELVAKRTAAAETSQVVALRVAAARARQAARLGAGRLNADMGSEALAAAVPLTGELGHYLSKTLHHAAPSMRRLDRVRRVARTVADLRGADQVSPADVAQALPLTGLL